MQAEGGGAPRAMGSAPSLELNHSLAGHGSQVGGLYGPVNWANQDHSFLERAEIAVHGKHSSPDHNPDSRCSCCSVLRK